MEKQILKIGSRVYCEYCNNGEAIAVTKEWIILKDTKSNEEYALYRPDDWFSLMIEEIEEGLSKEAMQEIKIEEEK